MTMTLTTLPALREPRTAPKRAATQRERRSQMVANILLADVMLQCLSMQKAPSVDDVQFWRFVRDEADDALRRGQWL